MITKKFRFSLATRYVGSEVSQEMELGFEDNATKDEIENEVEQIYNEWLGNQNYGGFHEIEK